MADGSTTTNQGDLKQKYAGDLTKQIQTKHRFWSDYVKTGSETLEGLGIFTAIHVGRNQSVQAQTELQALAAPQHQRKLKPQLTPKIYTASGQISGLTEAMAGGGAASFVDALDHDMVELMDAVKKRLNIDVWRDGNAIHTAITTTTASNATQPVDDPWLPQEYTVYDIYNSSLTTLVEANVQVLRKSVQGGTVTFDRAVSTTAGDVLVPAGEVSGAPSDGKAITGIEAIIDTTSVSSTYLTINRSTYTVWQGNVLASGGVSVSEDLLQRGEDIVDYVSHEEVNSIWSHKLQRRKYIGQLTPQKRFQSTDLRGGFDALDFNGKDWMTDVDHPRDEITMFGYEPEMFYTPGGQIHMDERGGTLKHRPGYDSSYFFAKMYGNLACRMPNANVRITGLATPSV